MIYQIDQLSNQIVEEYFRQSFSDLEDFFGFKWTKKPPKLIVIPSKEVADDILGFVAPTWLRGFGSRQRGAVYILKDSLSTPDVIKHELSHCFMDVLTNDSRQPYWLTEGLAVVLSGQLLGYVRPSSLSLQNQDYDSLTQQTYAAGGYLVDDLLSKYGKESLFQLLKYLRPGLDKLDFNQYFHSLYSDVSA